MNIIRVLVVSSKYPPEYAGSGLRAHNTYTRLKRKYGVEWRVVSGSIESNGIRKYKWEGVDVTRISLKFNLKWFVARAEDGWLKSGVKRLVRGLIWRFEYLMEALAVIYFMTRWSASYDLIHTFGKTNVTSAAHTFARISKKPIISEIVNLTDDPEPYEPYPTRLLYGSGFPKQALIVCISEYLESVCREMGYETSRLWCRPNPVDERFSISNGEGIRHSNEFSSLSDDDKVILHLAKFIPRKHQLFAVQVMTHLPENFKLVLAGPMVESGPLLERDRKYFESIMQTIGEKGLDGRVIVHPRYIENPQDYIRMADVFILPSTDEGCGTPVLEALACGVPVVVNDVPGVFDRWVDNGENGFICAHDHKAWADRIMKASGIPKEKMVEASNEVLNAASTEVIDKKYYEYLSSMAS